MQGTGRIKKMSEKNYAIRKLDLLLKQRRQFHRTHPRRKKSAGILVGKRSIRLTLWRQDRCLAPVVEFGIHNRLKICRPIGLASSSLAGATK